MWLMLHMPRARPHPNGNDLLQQVMLSIQTKCECRGRKRKYKLTHWDSDTFRWFHYIILYMIRYDMSHAFHIELVIAEALSIVIYYCCCCLPMLLLLLTSSSSLYAFVPADTDIIIMWMTRDNAFQSKLLLQTHGEREMEKLRESWHFAFEPIKRESVHFMRAKWTIDFKLCTAFICSM